jgi:flavin reductase (DIM6/NTAB) family NADH-FMN oxidoreductase RutF
VSVDAARYRQIVGHFATGVTVITTAVDGWLHGMTANAVASLSLDPLLFLVCVDKSAHMHGQMEKAGRFGVNVLASDQEDVSRLFATSMEPERERLGGFAYSLGQHGTPVLEKALAHIECDVTGRFEGGDHSIFIGTVLDGEVTREAPPLLFYRGGYRRIGE